MEPQPTAIPSPRPDADLDQVIRAREGDVGAFEEIVMKYQGTLAAGFHRFTTVRLDLEDMVQETFLRAWKGLPKWHPDKPFIHWLQRIATRVALEFCRRRKRSPLGHQLDDPSGYREEQPEHAAKKDIEVSSLSEAQALLALLPPEDCALLTLQYIEELPLQEISSRFGWSLTNTKVRAHRARNRLRKELLKHGYAL